MEPSHISFDYYCGLIFTSDMAIFKWELKVCVELDFKGIVLNSKLISELCFN